MADMARVLCCCPVVRRVLDSAVGAVVNSVATMCCAVCCMPGVRRMRRMTMRAMSTMPRCMMRGMVPYAMVMSYAVSPRAAMTPYTMVQAPFTHDMSSCAMARGVMNDTRRVRGMRRMVRAKVSTMMCVRVMRDMGAIRTVGVVGH